MIDRITPIFSARFALFCTTELYSDRLVYTTGVSINKKKREIPLGNVASSEYSPIKGMPGLQLTLNSGEQVDIKISAKDRTKLLAAWNDLPGSYILPGGAA